MSDQLFPEEFIRRITLQKYLESESLLKSLEDPSPVSIRTNNLKWRRIPADSEAVPWCHNGFYLPFRPSYTLDPLFHAGCYYPQEASGMFLEQVILQSGGQLNKTRVLDLCGAPGGKSTLLSDLIGPDSLVIANDVIRSRSLILAETITRWGRCNTVVTNSDPATFGKLPGFFDIILVDAPCSGEGMFRTDVAVSEWSIENTVLCAERQKRILMNIWPSLKENGLLIYSTCTFNPAENEENIKWLKDKNEAECIRIDLKSFGGIAEIDYQGVYGYGFYPDRIKGEGFFIAALRKKSTADKWTQVIKRQPDFRPLKADLNFTSGLTEFNPERFIKRGEEISALHCDISDYHSIFRNLRIIKSGTVLGQIRKNNLTPSHELALSVKMKRNLFPEYCLNLEDAISFLRRESINLGIIPEGWNILTYNGINLGFIKNLGHRINNYYPVNLRIRLPHYESMNKKIIVWQDNSEE